LKPHRIIIEIIFQTSLYFSQQPQSTGETIALLPQLVYSSFHPLPAEIVLCTLNMEICMKKTHIAVAISLLGCCITNNIQAEETETGSQTIGEFQQSTVGSNAFEEISSIFDTFETYAPDITHVLQRERSRSSLPERFSIFCKSWCAYLLCRYYALKHWMS